MADEDTQDPDGPIDGGLSQAMTGSEEFILPEDGDAKKSNPGMIVALVVALLGGGGYFWYTNQGPGKASAATAVAAAGPADGPSKTVAEFLSGGTTEVANLRQMLSNTRGVVQQFLAYPSMTQVPLEDLKTNPFRFSAPPAPSGEPSVAEATKKKEELRARSMKAVGELRVDSLMVGRNGAKGTAIINGKFVRTGDQVDSFTIEEIKQGSVVVRDEHFRFELRLSQ